MSQTLKRFREWLGPGPKDHFGAQDKVDCPKCGSGMYVLRRMLDLMRANYKRWNS